MLGRLRRRFGDNAPRRIDSDLLEIAEQCATNPLVQASFIQDAIYSNGDLSADTISVSDNEMRIIDWQFPRIASFDVECVNLLHRLGLIQERFSRFGYCRGVTMQGSVACRVRRCLAHRL